MPALTDRQIRERLIEEPREGWRLFIEQFTPTLLGIIERAGVRREDEAMEIYVRVCEHLAADDCARLRRHDPAKGRLAAWLTIVARNAIVDWVRSRKGRRRLFQSIRALGAGDGRIFELYYWGGHRPSEIAELVSIGDSRVTISDVFAALERIERALTVRQRAELAAMASRRAEPAPLEDGEGRLAADPAHERDDPERLVRTRQTSDALAAAIADLPAEEALIVSMRFLDGLSTTQVERALHVAPITADRMAGILLRLRQRLEHRGIDGGAIEGDTGAWERVAHE